MPRDAVSRTANVERTGRHKWVKFKKAFCEKAAWAYLRSGIYGVFTMFVMDGKEKPIFIPSSLLYFYIFTIKYNFIHMVRKIIEENINTVHFDMHPNFQC